MHFIVYIFVFALILPLLNVCHVACYFLLLLTVLFCLGGLRENRRHPATYLVHGAKALNNAFRGWTRKEVGVMFFHSPSMDRFCSFQDFVLLVCVNVDEASHHFAAEFNDSVSQCLVSIYCWLKPDQIHI